MVRGPSITSPRFASIPREAAGREGVERDPRVPTEDEIGDRMPYDGTIEDALASAARGHVDLI